MSGFAGLVSLVPSVVAHESSCSSATIVAAPCTFHCRQGSIITITGTPWDNSAVEAHAACGGNSVFCTAELWTPCSDSSQAKQDDETGTCFAVGWGTITCTATGGWGSGESGKACSAWVIGVATAGSTGGVCDFLCDAGDRITVSGAGTGYVSAECTYLFVDCEPVVGECVRFADGTTSWGWGRCVGHGWVALSCSASQ